ncbi:fluoride efflux transporter CrcB [Roseateles sp. DXS20W]|uniref:Fluoride-specific ion channel FluC n=1 Tax=Pelomonas lactea TaxID=3299030 RepID=A0ABW7GS53_9BURK
MNALAVALGAALGALARWQAGLAFNLRWAGFPLGTLLVNVAGGLLIGMALEWFGRQPNDVLKLLLVTGFLGGLTTFSAFSGESLALLRHGEFGMALTHTASHVLGSLLAAWAGMKLVQGLI